MGVLGVAWKASAEYFRESSVAGVNQAAKSKTWPWFVYWLAVFMAFGILTLSAIWGVMEDYYSYPYTTTTDLVYDSSLEFPAVTFCNLNRVNCENLLSEKMAVERRRDEALTAGDQASVDKFESELTPIDRMFFVLSGCQSQSCANLYSSVQGLLFDTNSSYFFDSVRATELLYEVDCKELLTSDDDSDSSDLFLNACMNVLYLNDTLEEDDPSVEKWQDVWDYLDCDVESICCSFDEKMSMPAPGGPHINTPTCEANPCEKSDGGKGGGDGPDDGDGGDGPDSGDDSQDDDDVTTTTTTTTAAPTTTAAVLNYESEFEDTFLKLNADTRRNIGHQRQATTSERNTKMLGFVQSATFRRTDHKNDTYWTEFNDATYGNCATFNSYYNPNKEQAGYPKTSILSGELLGFSAVLYLDQTNYLLNGLSKKAGVRVMVHDPELMPSAAEEGFDLLPGVASSIALHKNELSRLEEPYKSECISHWNQTDYATLNTSVKYSFSSCQKVCIQREIRARCGCYLSKLVQCDVPESEEGDACTAVEDMSCASALLDDLDSGQVDCSLCHRSCHEIRFDKTITASTWPSTQYWTTLAEEIGYEKRYIIGPDAESTEENIKINFLQVNVYYSTLDVRTVEQKGTYESGGSLVSSLGGALSLYLGMALIMMFELIELTCVVCHRLWRHYSKVEVRRRKKENGFT